MPHLVWFNRDLRALDNPALTNAARLSPDGVVALFLVCPEMWRAHDDAPAKIDFWLRNLAELSKRLAKLNIALLIREATVAGTPRAVLDAAREHRCDAVHFNLEYELNESARAHAVAAALAKHSISAHTTHDQCLVPPGEVRTGEGNFFTVFTPFRRALYRTLAEKDLTPLPEPRRQPRMVAAPDPIPPALKGFASTTDPKLWPAGEAHTHARLDAFIESSLQSYKDRRDLPAAQATSTLSPYLAAGVVSIRQCLAAAMRANNGRLEAGTARSAGADCWISELAWREFYRHVLVGFPRVCRHQPFKPATRRIKWSDDASAFQAWCNGRTGVPIVDAAMRQLNATGWMHNRLRMIAAMYLTKDLFIDWRRGERYFMQNLIDGDLASNNGGWQWSASTGTDAAPYFRIFNPVSQSKKCDPDGAFIRRWLPELASLSSDDIHDPSQLPPLARARLDYPEPIADHAAARDRVMAAFKGL